MAKKHPRQGADLNNGVYRTDKKFLEIVKREFHIECDLAASPDNAVAERYFTKETDSLKQEWPIESGWNWLNPPFDRIGPWARKCWEEAQRGAGILFLVPASVGSNWYRDYVHGKAEVRLLNGRLTFEGHTHPYPKDLLLAIYDTDRASMGNVSVWNWRKEVSSDD